MTRPAPASSIIADLTKSPRYVAALLAVAAVLVYWHTLGVPFYLDDFKGIIENRSVHDLTDLAAIWQFSAARFVGSLSFAFNYAFNGTSEAGYHVVNLLVHLGAALALWTLLTGLIRSPGLRDIPHARLKWLPLLAALLFVVHPLQTQAVTYIVQRYASLAAFFYLASVAAFVWGRLERRWSWLAIALAFALLAFLTKQNSATLPAAMVLIELLFFRRLGTKGRWTVIGISSITIAALAYALSLPFLDAITRETSEISRFQYFSTQLGILWNYIGLFFVPVDQRLEYYFPLVAGSWGTAIYFQLAGHLLALALAFALWTRAPLIAFGILFYYLAHTVESSIFPITDLAFEHRTYLPNAGLVVALASLPAWLIGEDKARYLGAGMAVVLLASYGWSAYQRNELWRDPIAFLQADVRLSPEVERAWTSLGKEHMRRGEMKKALFAFGKALNLSRTEDGLKVRPSTLVNTILALHYTGQHKKAFDMANWLQLANLTPTERSRLFEVRGAALLSLKLNDLARQELKRALAEQFNPNAAASLATLEYREGEIAKARKLVSSVLDVNPSHPVAIKLLQELGPAGSATTTGSNRPQG